MSGDELASRKTWAQPVGRQLTGLRLPLAVFLASALPLLANLLGAGELYGVFAGLVAFTALVVAAVRLTNAPLVRRPQVELTIDSEYLRIGRRRVRRQALTRGVATPVEGGTQVQLRTTPWAEPIVLHFDDPSAAHALLAELELDASGRTAHFWAQSSATAWRGFVPAVSVGGLFVTGLMVYGVAAVWPGALVVSLMALYGLVVLGAGVPVSVSVGLDGLSVRRATGSEFLPWAQITKSRRGERAAS
jgi:hypothetical protein